MATIRITNGPNGPVKRYHIQALLSEDEWAMLGDIKKGLNDESANDTYTVKKLVNKLYNYMVMNNEIPN